MRPFKFWASCPQLEGELVQYLTDSERAVRITYSTFARYADLEAMRKQNHPAMYRISCANNWSISFWKSRLPSGTLVYYFDWSRIEHVFVDREIDMKDELDLLTAITSSL